MLFLPRSFQAGLQIKVCRPGHWRPGGGRRSPCVLAATSTSWTASSSRLWTATGTAGASGAATAARRWPSAASAAGRASTARTTSSSASGPSAPRASWASRPRRWCAAPRTSCTTCTASPASCASGSWPRETSSTSWRTAGSCARQTTRPPSSEVWFQNRRAKEKRLKKDAGRQRWGQYFRNMKRARGGSKSDKDSVQEEGQDSDAEVSFTDEPAMVEMGPANGLYGSLGEPAPALGRPSGAPGSFPLEHGGLAGPEQYRELRPGSPYGVPPSPAALQSLPGPQPLLSSLVYPDAGLGLLPSGAPGGPSPMRVLAGNGPSSDLSTGSSGGYPDFPASPASWLDEVDHAQF
ncbi:LIM/homeobox protein Lhx3 isoform X3 [Tursiops truncatus]|uniref:LIM/homeobox protein Lhx3 isoform X3 n=1 Tax=Tursiops truncatus TaxID=9739 RepID=UPI003CCFC320